jgi:hypothetical protein
MTTLLIFSHQLFITPRNLPEKVAVVLIEDVRRFRPGRRWEEAVFQRAAFQAVREQLLVAGIPVHYMGADHTPRLRNALAEVEGLQPEKVLWYAHGDSHIEAELRSWASKAGLTFEVLTSPVPALAKRTLQYEPKHFPAIEMNRYVEEASAYASQQLGVEHQAAFGYPATPGDAEDWLEDVPTLLAAGSSPRDLLTELWPLLSTGMITPQQLQTIFPSAALEWIG